MRAEHHYPVPPSVLFSVLVDPAFLRARSARFGGRGEPTASPGATGMTITVPRVLPLDDVPGPLRRFAGTGELVQVDRWTEIGEQRVSGSWTTDVGGASIELHGTHEIIGTAAESRYQVTGRVNVRIPLVGRQIEQMVTGHLETLMRRELEFTADWLRRGA